MGRAGGGSRGGSFGGGSRGGSFGGGSRGGSFGGGASRGRSSGGSSWSGRSSHPVVRPTIVMGPRIDRRTYGGGPSGSGPSRPNGQDHKPKNGSSLLSFCKLIMILSALMLGVVILFAMLPSDEKVERTPLPAGSVQETAYYTDELGWIDNKAAMIAGLERFYKLTGVQPYVYITDHIGSGSYASDQEIMDFAETKYDQLFTDEAHVLLIFYEKDDAYRTYCLAGIQAANAVMDDAARTILLDKIDTYYYSSGLSDEAFFAKSFTEAGEEIMEDNSLPAKQMAAVLGVIFCAALLGMIVLQRKEKARKQQEELERMLDTPLETFGDREAEELAKKYE